MRKAPAPSKLTKKQLEEIMIDDTIKGLRYYNRGKIDEKAEANEVQRNRRIQEATNYQEYRDWYKGLSPENRTIIATVLGW